MDRPTQVVWFKRDLRTRDHRPLAEAARRGPVLPLYVAEPSVVDAPDFAPRHWTLIRESLIELRARLADLGQPLVVRIGAMPDVLATLRDRVGDLRLWAHEETGNGVTFDRDTRVRRWCRAHDVPFTEIPHMGVVRPLPDRDGWADRWEEQMTQPLIDPPDTLRPVDVDPGPIPTHAALDLAPCTAALQKAGPSAAHDVLNSFLFQRGRTYRGNLSSPLTAQRRCSRISIHLAYGTISMRTVVHALRERTQELAAINHGDAGQWRQSLRMFDSRLHWHSHFMQKLEDAPRIEHESFIPAFDDLREGEFDADLFDAWKHGQTGFPMVDACMRCLRTTGWLNFRMRAMLCSFAAYDCWLDWRRFAPFYARMMADYEPGIHYPQVQMQSGTTGINAVRIYNPIKQGKDHDPDGTFIQRWVPELRGITHAASIHEPWTMSPIEAQAAGCVVGRDYPERIVDHTAAYHHAQDRIWTLREQPEIQAQKETILERHGSRR
jgi:deoxyribodipyrimidine photo-lyase